jgi:oligoendopeptidase F
MSKKILTDSSKSCFTYTPTHDLPALSQIQTEWNLVDHYYQDEHDPQIEKDAQTYERALIAFVKKYQQANFTDSAVSLLTALKDNEKLEELTQGAKIIRYFSYRSTLNVNDNAANRKLNLYSDRFRKVGNELLFFPLTIGKISKEKQKQFLTDTTLAKYHYLLKQSFESAKHHLTEPEERILSLRSNTSSGMWADAVEKIVSNRTVTFQKKKYTLPEAFEHISTVSWQDKNVLWEKILTELVQISEVAEHELTAIVTHEKVSDELRGYKKPYSATVEGYENNEKAVEALVEAISTKGFALSKKFYKLKAKLHGMEKIPYVNKYDPIGELAKPNFTTTVSVCRDAFYRLDTRYGSIFDQLLQNGHLDVYPKAGKRGGAFMSSAIGLPTYVMLNYKDDFKSLETLAHEMGHAVHAEQSKSQPTIYQDFSTVTAETASTLFEQHTMDTLYQSLNDAQKVIFLHDKITRDIATVQRQIACFNFELAMHTHVREHGLITKEELAKLMQKHMQAYLGTAVEVTERDGYSYVHWSHIRYGFYVYSYTYGHLVSNLMLQKYHADPRYIAKINQFLSAGGSDTVENIFKAIGINTMKVETFLASLETQEREIKELERLTRKKTT